MPDRSTPPQPRSHRRLRRASLLVALALIATLVGFLAQDEVVLASGRSSRDAALQGLDRAIAQAEADGVPSSALAAVRANEQGLVARTSGVGSPVDLGGAVRLDRERAVLQSLTSSVAAIESAVLRDERAFAVTLLSRYEAAITAAHDVGIDSSGDGSIATKAARLVSNASTPAKTKAALSDVPQLITALQQHTKDVIQQGIAAALVASRSRSVRVLATLDVDLKSAEAQMHVDFAATQRTVAEQHAAFEVALTADQYDKVTAAATFIDTQIGILVDSFQSATAEVSSARRALQQAAAAGLNAPDLAASIDALAVQVAAADTAGKLDSLASQIAMKAAPVADRIGVTVGAGKVIVVSLDRQELSAYQDGVPVLSTFVTTGRPVLPTPPGTTTIFGKNHPFLMRSSWPVGTIGWYEPSWVEYVMWFRGGGFGIHDAPWRSRYGPGTNDGNGTHGCINVPGGLMPTLYAWADLGTTVIVH